jgi:acetyl/propionyl-CoA carboxylase alpha subunit
MTDQPQRPRRLTRLLIANRGEIARRITRAARGLGIETVAVFSDADATAVYVTECDLAVRLPGTAAATTYLDVAAIIDAARRSGADAVHPGYGFLAENADAAQAIINAGLTWVGPPPAAMRALASKLTAKDLVADAGVPVLPSVRLDGDDEQEWTTAVEGIGYPVLLKASAGGGGRGMRVVDSPAGLGEAVRAARREAQAAFGDPTVFCERLVRRGRHVEVQVIGDLAGTILHVYERECSLQRRHQKILEESPSPGTHADVLARMTQAAVAVAKAVDYSSLGTVEFLLDEADTGGRPGAQPDAELDARSGPDPDARFYFLEMNTRLQVEHPVTEMLIGIDLVEYQLRLAGGEPLDLEQSHLVPFGHAVEVRLVAEDAAAGWVPSSGTLTRFEPPEIRGVRWESAVRTGSVVPPHYDSLLAKVIAHGESRDEAFDLLRAALRGLRVHGVATNREVLLALLDDPDVRAGRTTIDLLESRADSLLTPLPPEVGTRHALVAALAAHCARAADAPHRHLAPGGWRSMADAVDTTVLVAAQGPASAPSTVVLRTTRHDQLTAVVDGSAPMDVRVHNWDGEWLDHEVDGVRARAAVLLGPETDDEDRTIDVFGAGYASRWVEPARLPAGDRAETARGPSSPVPGTVVAVHVSPGDVVAAGDALVVLEAMKMEHRITANSDAAVVEVAVAVGDAVDAHEVLVVLEPKERTDA